MRKIFIILGLALAMHFHSNAQGCVAIRSNGSTCTMMDAHDGTAHEAGKWSLALNSRYFKSYKHFVGKEEQKERADAGITPNPNPRANENINPNDQKDTTQTTGGEMTDGEDG